MIAVNDPSPRGAARGPRLRPVDASHAATPSALTHLLISGAAGDSCGMSLDSGIIATSAPPAAPRDSRLRPFQRVGPYRLLARLGRGAQGEVWKAVRGDARSHVVALKILNQGLSIHPRRLAQFRREAERGARLAGPSLLQVVDAGEADGCFYMAMPYVEAATLHDVIHERRVRRMGEPALPVHPLVAMADAPYYVEAARALARAARALDHVHVHRVAHRDVKPANILLERRRPFGVYLCDLGLGRDLDLATSEQMRDGAGTPMYMSPERLLKAPADEVLSDVYSMGVTLFETLTLGRLFETIRDVPPPALASLLARARPRRPRAVDPSLPDCFEAVILKATARDPDARFRSAAELASALERALPEARRELGLVGPPPRPRFLTPRPHRSPADVRAEVR
ncbi:serine/threonine-protein kinase [Paludisphaera mucosa]|uniref:Serine/threonine-protein kinase n=1 Tax=Paludisphaera mucosa TaxID=3030827 RepID=A0ABT6F3Q0_9BACT|nr:serine/threonine-protein kinase [Paludisphaera mucosa]MDG3002197.1 serine/threonine-protein kinase [Paludisphaera mucosa]